MQTGIAAIVVTFHTGPRLRECLHALISQEGISEIVIVDNGNPEQMVSWLETFAARKSSDKKQVRYLQTRENIGFGSAVNLGAMQARSKHLLIINPDCVMRPDALAPLMEAAETLGSPWIVGGRIFSLDGRAQHGPQRRELTLRRLFSRIVGGAGINMPLSPQPDDAIRVDVISGAFFLIDRAGFDQIGGFDEHYFLHVEDIDICKRVHLAGGNVRYQPRAGALHYGATSDVSKLKVERFKAAGFAHYFRKFSTGPVQRIAAELSIPVIYAALMVRAALGGR